MIVPQIPKWRRIGGGRERGETSNEKKKPCKIASLLTTKLESTRNAVTLVYFPSWNTNTVKSLPLAYLHSVVSGESFYNVIYQAKYLFHSGNLPLL